VVEHQVDEDTRDRDIEPKRECPSGDGTMAGKIAAQRPNEREQHHRDDNGSQKGVGNQDGEIDRAHPARARKFRRPRMGVINGVTDEKGSGRNDRPEHASAMGSDIAAAKEKVTCDEQGSARRIQQSVKGGQGANVQRPSLPQQFSDVGDEFLHLLFVRPVIKAPNATLSVYEDEAVAVDEIGSASFVLRFDFCRCHLKAMPRQSVNRLLVACHENPLALYGVEVFAILPQDFGCVVLGVNGETDEADIGVVGEGFLHPLHVAVHVQADARAGGEKEFGDPNFALQVRKGNGFAVVGGEAEIRDRPIDRKPTPSLPSLDESNPRYHAEGNKPAESKGFKTAHSLITCRGNLTIQRDAAPDRHDRWRKRWCRRSSRA